MKMQDILYKAWDLPFSTKGDLARSEADMIAMAASDGYLSTRIAAGLYDRRWHITPAGLSHLEKLTGMRS